MRLTICSLFTLSILFSLVSCSDGDKSNQQKKIPKPAIEKVDDALAVTLKNGKKLYIQHCSVCHMPKGDGIPGLNPPLINTDWVTGDIDRLVNIVVNGLEEEIEINGQKYIGPMIGLPYLKDQEIADILTYVRDRFGKGASQVTLKDVVAARG